MCKKCSKCNTEYCNISESFHKRKQSKDGFSNICRYCKLNNRHILNHINNDGLLLCIKCNIYKNEDDFDSSSSCWFRKNKERRCKDCKKKQYEIRRTQNRGDQGIERLLVERFNALKDRAKNKNLTVDFDKEYLRYLWEKQNHKCALSGIQMTTLVFKGRVFTNISVDRINSKKGYLKSNVQLVCMGINQMKNDLSTDELLYFCKQIIKNHET